MPQTQTGEGNMFAKQQALCRAFHFPIDFYVALAMCDPKSQDPIVVRGDGCPAWF
jgi:hypothetical protein